MPIPTLDGYSATEGGIILSPRGKPLKQWQDTPGGAFRVYADKRARMVSYLVLTSRTGIPPEGYFVAYRDKDKSNSQLSNLMWKNVVH